MIKKHYYGWTDIERMCVSIVNQMYMTTGVLITL